MNRSISFRLTCWFSAIFLAGFLCFGLVMWLDLALQLSQGRDRTLGRRGTRCFDLLKATWNQDQRRKDEKFEEFTDAMPEGNLIVVYDRAGNRVYSDPASPPGFPWPSTEGLASDRYENKWFASRLYRVLTRPVSIQSERLTIQVGGQLEDNRQLLARFQTGLAAATPVLLALSALCGYLLSRRALLPVDRLISGVRSISARDLSARLPVHPTGDELQRLAETCNDMLARVENAVTRIHSFTADASHDLRSPISFVHTISEYALQHHALDAETREVFHDILAESEDAAKLLEDMLTLARADEGRLVVNLVPLDLAEILRDVGEKARTVATSKEQTFKSVLSAEPLMIEGDDSSLRRLFSALIDNAVKYTANGGRIELSANLQAQHSVVRLHDNGVGIPRELQRRIFERFFRADPSRGAGGTGLGLAIAKWIADAHHASILVESEPGAGTTLEVSFPALHADGPGRSVGKADL